MLPAMLDESKIIVFFAAAIGAYLVGSVNTSIIACRLLKLGDLRQTGSGNPGATNLLRKVGWRIAIPVLLVDMGKTGGTICATRALGFTDIAPLFALPVLLGNMFPVFHHFRGGKGVAATVGLFLAISPTTVLIAGVLFLVVVAISRRVSLGSILMVASYPLWLQLLGNPGRVLIVSATFAFVILVTHRANIARLIRGTEPKLGAAGKDHR